jgi:hypothetical protein
MGTQSEITTDEHHLQLVTFLNPLRSEHNVGELQAMPAPVGFHSQLNEGGFQPQEHNVGEALRASQIDEQK